MSEPRIDVTRLLEDLERLARVGGRADGGVTRLAFSSEDREGRDVVEALLAEIGVSCRFDPLGNLLAVREGAEPDGGLVLTGSHTDTVGAGGRYDGALGVLAGVAVLRAIDRAGVRTRLPVGVVSFVNEEGVRFMPDMMGSLFVRGDLDLTAARSAVGTDGVTLGRALDASGMAGTADLSAVPVSAFLELHIEQGPVLDGADEPVGVVTGVQGLRWLRIRLEGASNHAGTTPMTARRDAGLAAAHVVTDVRSLSTAVDGLRATCGRLVQEPNLVNVIPGRVELTVDLRHPRGRSIDEAEERVRALVSRHAAAEGIQAVVERMADAPPVAFDPRIVETVEGAAASLGYPCRRMTSGAGHDAQIMSIRWPTAMLFVRSRDGISHSPSEYTAPGDLAAGAEVLLRSVLELAGRAS